MPDGTRFGVHPAAAYAMSDHESSHYARGSGIPEVSTVLGCPRRNGIQASEPWWADPRGMSAAQSGTAKHAIYEQYAPKHELAEVKVQGTINGVVLQGKVDSLRKDPYYIVEDFKTQSDFVGAKTAKGDGYPKKQHVAQNSLYAELVNQTLGWKPETGIIWYETMLGGQVPYQHDIMTVPELLEFRPLDGDLPILELLKHAETVAKEPAKWKDLPLAGRTQKYGEKIAGHLPAAGHGGTVLKCPCWGERGPARYDCKHCMGSGMISDHMVTMARQNFYENILVDSYFGLKPPTPWQSASGLIGVNDAGYDDYGRARRDQDAERAYPQEARVGSPLFGA